MVATVTGTEIAALRGDTTKLLEGEPTGSWRRRIGDYRNDTVKLLASDDGATACGTSASPSLSLDRLRANDPASVVDAIGHALGCVAT